MVWFYLRYLPLDRIDLRLSIPLWSDFIFYEKIKDGDKWKTFQSHYGLILSTKYPVYIERPLNIFQSHYGLILSTSWNHN